MSQRGDAIREKAQEARVMADGRRGYDNGSADAYYATALQLDGLAELTEAFDDLVEELRRGQEWREAEYAARRG